MSFYNVTNPSNFSVLDLANRQGAFKQSGLFRADATQILAADTTLTASQVIAGVIVVNTTAAARTITLPDAAVLLAALNAGSYASSPVSLDDVLFLSVIAFGSGANAVTVQTAGAATSTTVAARTSEIVGIKFTNVTAGAVAMSIVN